MTLYQKLKDVQAKKSNKKGFTLVELIVVLVILAILAAILVPALLGYIDRAKNQQYVLNAKAVYEAAQADLSELYATGSAATTDRVASIKDTADSADDVSFEIYVTSTDVTKTDDRNNYKITGMSYTEDGKTLYFDGNSWVDSVVTFGDTYKKVMAGTTP